MLPAVNGNIQAYIDGLDRVQSEMNTVQRQISSGVRVGVPSDDPIAVPSILQTQTGIGMTTQLQANLNQVQTDLNAGDYALQQAVKLMDQAVSLGTQGSSTTLAANEFPALAQQVQGIQKQLVGLTATAVNGRYIFGGDFDQQAPYQADASGNVTQSTPGKSTAAIAGPNGDVVWQPKTAQDIFDARNPDGSQAAGNVFAAVAGLISALQKQDTKGAQDAVAALHTASDHLNQQLGLYGIGETNVTNALNTAAGNLTADKKTLSDSRDTDIAAAAEQLSQVTLQQQAALTIGPKIYQYSLFNFMA